MSKLLSIATAAILAASPANAYDWMIEAHVTVVEASYMPDRVTFAIDQAPSTSCPVNTFLIWEARGSDAATRAASSQGVLSTLLTALVGQRTVRLYGSNTGCSIQFIHIL